MNTAEKKRQKLRRHKQRKGETVSIPRLEFSYTQKLDKSELPVKICPQPNKHIES